MIDRRPRTSPEPGLLRVVTYNIHKGIGGIDRRYRPERIIETLRHYGGDLVFLQEVDEGVPRSRHDRQVDLLGDELGYEHRVFFPNVRLKIGHYGNALLSHFPIDHRENIDLTIPLKKKRGALHVRISLSAGNTHHRMWLFNVHLGLARYERRRQIERLLRWQHHHRLRHDTGVILGGDLNDVYGRLGRPLFAEGYEGLDRSLHTFPAARPLRSLDRFFVRGPLKLRRCFRGETQLARQASDHLPLIADLEWK